MRKTLTGILLILTTLPFISCERGNIDGKWDDNIKLSAKDIVFDKFQHSYTFKTESTSWWLNDITYKENVVDLNGIEKTAKNFSLTQPDFQIKRQDDGKTVIVTMNENNSNSERVLRIGMQSGDYFDGIKVTQTK